MKARILATLVLWTLIIGLPALLGKWGAFLIILAFSVMAFIELTGLFQRAGRPLDRPVVVTIFALSLTGLMAFPPWIIPPMAIFALTAALLLGISVFKGEIGTITPISLNSLGAVFLFLVPFATAVLIIHEAGIVLLIWIIAVAKFCDVGALLTGLWLGKHPMAPALSPKKTWEGLTGGLLLAVIVSVGFVLLFENHLPADFTLVQAAWKALFIALAGVIGDLLESAFKREANVKDSGSLIPGIGGMLDLSDSVILAFPVGYFFIWLMV
jgi:phosphatidate cytidylyltransferase